ncbi:TPA: glycoside hydrolase family 1 protein [Streptococcus equi subsp. zooepidemicus]|uniref:glycoside hydrolase family 1 protein n=1 Tax=Streptococcus equi TaxID=1336 RepID=UPI000311D67A|nr:glycoside hydrolase family 1 protein [Streptococcus equi]HEL0216451.1 glycoside hydrolase family 1 protein [Streptococcus equi subsp. zooepidemicus]HEL0220742.1 glycoside hydrolase family 1 protein [Streptococcus equi subsp. zooepidemicus]HEL0602459.1 glycoside hydrolase family 1 protein [Streptococcus equi subsp. zooepidemicus]HEL0762201.1 glycoside hydrolase family 1 protein [Streptococcus equi subsp. zooepidemicus]HEL0798792.1 glycoside hydrolase family 1 protein [Streptococcus equi subs
MLEFPEGFWWGGATSGPQSEGCFQKPHRHLFDYWYEQRPELFYDYVGPDTASDFFHQYDQDLALLASLGHNSYRTSIQWTRLIDDFETATINPEGLAYYNRVIDACLAHGMRPVINLHHFDLPIALYQKYGGWESKHVVDLFVAFARVCFEQFGDRVKDWFVHNEPMVVVEGSYLLQFHYPAIVDGKKAVQVAYNLALATAKVICAYREQAAELSNGRVGTILNLTPVYPATDSEADLAAAHIAELWNNDLFMSAAVYGSFPKELVAMLKRDGVLWQSTPEELALIAAYTVDYVGINFYHPKRVKAPEVIPVISPSWSPEWYYDAYLMPKRRMNVDKGWEIYPEAVYDIALKMRDQYRNIPWFLSENGVGISGEDRYRDESGQIQDDYRIQFLKEHLTYLHKGIQAGSNCFGYHVWTPIDCWSWLNAYKNRYGLVENNHRTQLRRVKKSGYWFKEVAEANGIS